MHTVVCVITTIRVGSLRLTIGLANAGCHRDILVRPVHQPENDLHECSTSSVTDGYVWAIRGRVMMMQSTFQRIISILVIMHIIGCTSLKPIEAGPHELQEKIRHGNIVNIHDWVKVYTEDGKEYQFQITEIDEKYMRGDDFVRGDEVSVPIDSIVALESQEVSIGKTSFLVGGGISIALLIAIVVAPAAILAAGAP
jgi:hypothetical protein